MIFNGFIDSSCPYNSLMSINKNILHAIHNPPKIKKIKLPSFRSPKGIFRVRRDNSFFLKI